MTDWRTTQWTDVVRRPVVACSSGLIPKYRECSANVASDLVRAVSETERQSMATALGDPSSGQFNAAHAAVAVGQVDHRFNSFEVQFVCAAQRSGDAAQDFAGDRRWLLRELFGVERHFARHVADGEAAHVFGGDLRDGFVGAKRVPSDANERLDDARIDLFGKHGQQAMANKIARRGIRVGVGDVFAKCNCVASGVCLDFAAANLQHRPDEHDVAILRERSDGAHCREAAKTRAAKESQEYGFGLIFRVMGDRDDRRAALAGGLFKE